VVRFQLHMKFSPQPCDEAAGVLRSLVGSVRAEPGCSATRLLEDMDDSCSLTFVEEWRSQSDFEAHLRSKAFRKILAVIELAAGAPAIEIDEVTTRRGFDLVEEILDRPAVGTAGRGAV
jgi:quinol monooxygenase YgiN